MEFQPLFDTLSDLIQQGATSIWSGIAFLTAMLFKQVRTKLDSLLTKLITTLLDYFAEYAQKKALLRHSDGLFQRRYHKHLGYEHRVFNVRGLRTMGTVTLELVVC